VLPLLAFAALFMARWDNTAKRFRRGSSDVDVASASRASGNSGAIDGADVAAIDALIDVTIAPGTSLNVAIEESSDGTGSGLGAWSAVANANQNTIGQNRVRGVIVRRFYRFVWTVVGANPTFSITADKKGSAG
jgi:hypothetical protein